MSWFSLAKRQFSSRLTSKKVLVSAGLGNAVPTAALDALTHQDVVVDTLDKSKHASREQNKSAMLSRFECTKYDALYVGVEDIVDSEVIQASLPECKIISTMSVGHNHIDTALCKSVGVRVGFTPDILTETTADFVVALTLATARKMLQANQAISSGEWGSWQPLWMAGKDVHGSKVGIIGMGRIGLAVARRFNAFGCTITYCNSSGNINQQAQQLNCELVSLESLLLNSDFVIPLCPLTSDTMHLMNESSFNLMKRDSILINCSRGEVVHQQALIDALLKQRILAAGLDVMTPEPLPLDHPLLQPALRNKLTLLPHIGSASVGTRTNMALLASQNILDVFQNKEPTHFVC